MTRDEAIAYLERADTTVYAESKTRTAEALEMAIEALKGRKTAMWMPDEISCTGFICSNPDCWKKEFWTSPYCPNCGAMMEGEGDETD